MAGRVNALLADAARARGRHCRLHPARPAAHEAVRRSGRRLRARRRPLPRPVPDRRPPRALGIIVGILNTYHHFALPALAPVAWNLVIIVGLVLGIPRIDDGERAAVPLRRRRRARHARPAPPADPVAATPRRETDAGSRLARPRGQARPRADAAGHAHDRPHQRELPRRHAVRVSPARPRARAGGDRSGLPPVHAPAGRLRGRGYDRALPDARAPCGARRLSGCDGRSTGGSGRSRSCSFPPALVSIVLAEPIVELVYQRGEFTAEDTVDRRPVPRRRSRSGSCSTAGC